MSASSLSFASCFGSDADADSLRTTKTKTRALRHGRLGCSNSVLRDDLNVRILLVFRLLLRLRCCLLRAGTPRFESSVCLLRHKSCGIVANLGPEKCEDPWAQHVDDALLPHGRQRHRDHAAAHD